MSGGFFKVPDKAPEVDPPKVGDVIDKDIETATVYAGETDFNVGISLNGSPWDVVYFNQVLRTNDTPRQLDTGIDPSLQQYVRVKNYELSVTDGLDFDYDQTNGISELTGGAEMWPGLAPHIGDMFVARMKGNRMGLFVVKTAVPMQYLSYTGYRITYELFDYHNDDYQTDLDRKVIKEMFFDKDSRGCVDALEEGEKIVDVGLVLARLTQWWYDEYYDLMTETALYPRGSKTYDPFVVSFFRELVNRNLRGYNPLVSQYSCENGHYKKNIRTIFDLLIDNNAYGLSFVSKSMKTVYSTSFLTGSVYNNIGTTAVREVIWPTTDETLVASSSGFLPGEYYVFSKAFYESDLINMVYYERMVYEALRGTKATVDELTKLVDSMESMSTEKRFYMIPVTIYLLLHKYR